MHLFKTNRFRLNIKKYDISNYIGTLIATLGYEYFHTTISVANQLILELIKIAYRHNLHQAPHPSHRLRRLQHRLHLH